MQTLFKNQDNLCYVFDHKDPNTLLYAMSHNFCDWHLYITKSMTHWVTTCFYVQKPETFRIVRQFLLPFYIQKA